MEGLNSFLEQQNPQMGVGQVQGSYLGVEVNGPGDIPAFTPGSGSSMDDLLQWAFLHEDIHWNMESVLGEYVYGDPIRSAGMFSNF